MTKKPVVTISYAGVDCSGLDEAAQQKVQELEFIRFLEGAYDFEDEVRRFVEMYQDAGFEVKASDAVLQDLGIKVN